MTESFKIINMLTTYFVYKPTEIKVLENKINLINIKWT